MFLYLIQHAEAKQKEEDPLRPLSEKGIADIKKVAAYIARLRIEVAEILHSDKLRAKQTAQSITDYIHPWKGIYQADGLAPLDEPTIWEERLNVRTDNLMLVGHLPNLGKLASLLLSGNSERNSVAFKNACVVCIERDELGAWSLQWMITPDMVYTQSQSYH